MLLHNVIILQRVSDLKLGRVPSVFPVPFVALRMDRTRSLQIVTEQQGNM